MASLNRACLIGNLGQDPDVRSMKSGGKIVNLSVATSESWKDKSTGEKKEKTEWHRVVIFNENLAEIAEKYLHKGSKVYIEGQIQTRKWKDKDNVERYSTEIVLQGFNAKILLLDGAKRDGGDGGRPGGNGGGSGHQTSRTTSADMDDEIPF